MLSVITQHIAPPIGSEVWNVSRMVSHIPENAQNGMSISATDTKVQTVQTDLHHQHHQHRQHQHHQHHPSSGAICEKSGIKTNETTTTTSNDIKSNIRKNAVENLVDTTVLIIDEIWYNFPVNPNSQVIPLRLFIQETLRRSRTSWSTLQTALFYLISIKQHIHLLWLNPDRFLNSKEDDSSSGSDPATCGRRMFLASLIVASKYLQDRNYANNAWSKICGLPVQEINILERRFLCLIDYKLFISESNYKTWTTVLRSLIQNISENSPKSDSSVKNQQAVAAKLERTLQQCKVQG